MEREAYPSDMTRCALGSCEFGVGTTEEPGRASANVSAEENLERYILCTPYISAASGDHYGSKN